MDKIKNSRRCSPYLLKPLRTLDQALKDQAVIIQQHNITLLKQRGLPSPRAQLLAKKGQLGSLCSDPGPAIQICRPARSQ